MKDQTPVNLELYSHQKCLSKIQARLLASALDVERWKEYHSSSCNKKKANHLQNIFFFKKKRAELKDNECLKSKAKGAS